MADVLYLLGTVAFFWLMLVYVRGCAALGSRADTEVQGKVEQ